MEKQYLETYSTVLEYRRNLFVVVPQFLN